MIDAMLPLLVVAALLALALGHDAIDLSLEWEESDTHNANPGAAALTEALSSQPSIRSALLIEHGKIAASYYRDDVAPTALYPVFSVTKSYISLLIGMLVDDGTLSLEDTLGDVFPDPDGTIWPDVDEADFVSNVTIGKMLTMTSGLVSPVTENWFDPQAIGGDDLVDALNLPDVGTKGDFSYLGTSNIMSYVIKKRSGRTPMELVAERVFPALGIDPDDIDWSTNRDDMQHSYHGLSLNANQMGKFGQLFLQEGMASEQTRVVSKEWVDESTRIHVEQTSFPFIKYGYLFWILDGPGMGFDFIGQSYCAFGLGSQQICVRPDIGRVYVQQNDLALGASVEDDFGADRTALFTVLNENTDFGGVAVEETVSDSSQPTKSPAQAVAVDEMLPETSQPTVAPVQNKSDIDAATNAPTAAPSKNDAGTLTTRSRWIAMLLALGVFIAP